MRKSRSAFLVSSAIVYLICGVPVMRASGASTNALETASLQPWQDKTLPPEQRARSAAAAMTTDELLDLVDTKFPALGGVPAGDWDHKLGAGYTSPVRSIGLPRILEVDGSIGVGDAVDQSTAAQATAFPSMISNAASWSTDVVHGVGAAVAREARARGYNVLLSGGSNLIRDPRDGRAFEYLGEDPLLTGTLAAAYVNGVQSQHVVAALKHVALNDYETSRTQYDVQIDRRAAMESDLLAYDIALQESAPGAVMCSYNLVGGDYACQNRWLLTDVLRHQWDYRGWVMSDWGATHSTLQAITAGLDQESAGAFDVVIGLGGTPMLAGNPPSATLARKLEAQTKSGALSHNAFFADPLRKALADGAVSKTQLREMAEHILYGLYATGVADAATGQAKIDQVTDYQLSEAVAEKGIVLLKNADALLPLRADGGSIAVIGIHADKGVMSGAGSPAVVPFGGNAVPGKFSLFLSAIWDPSAPLTEMRKLSAAPVSYSSGTDRAAAVKAAKGARRVVLFAYQHSGEGRDLPNLDLPDHQDQLISAVAAANPNVVVVLETSGPVKMPWLGKVKSVVEAWYPGSGGGEAIAKILFGRAEPQGRLPQTFPASEADLPRSHLPVGPPLPENGRPQTFKLAFNEGSDVGYKWFEKRHETPLFPFGYGLSYTSFSLGEPHRLSGQPLTVQVDVTNTGSRPGVQTVQAYVDAFQAQGEDVEKRLVGWTQVALAPGERHTAEIVIRPQLLATYDLSERDWRIAAGNYTLRLGSSSQDLPVELSISMPAQTLQLVRAVAP